MGRSGRIERNTNPLHRVLFAAFQRLIGGLESRVDPQLHPQLERLPPDSKKHRTYAKKRKQRAKTQPPSCEFDLRTEVYKLFGVDVTQIPGLEFLALPLFSEIGRNMSCWPTAANFVSWLALCPDHDISGGRVLWRGRRRAHNRAGQLFRMAAYSLNRSPTPLGAPCPVGADGFPDGPSRQKVAVKVDRPLHPSNRLHLA
jgi:hypothetical protein